MIFSLTSDFKLEKSAQNRLPRNQHLGPALGFIHAQDHRAYMAADAIAFAADLLRIGNASVFPKSTRYYIHERYGTGDDLAFLWLEFVKVVALNLANFE